MKIYLGSDHGGFALKAQIKVYLDAQGYITEDCGNVKFDPADDFPIFAETVGKKVALQPLDRGILLCRSGAGVTIAVNKIDGIRAAIGIDPTEVKFNRQHDDINVLTISGDHTSFEQACQLINVFLTTEFTHEARHVRRLEEISKIEQTN